MPGVTHPVVQPQVLIVEDDPDVRGAMAEALHDEGFEVSMAINAVEALRVLAALESPCLVLLDWEIPRVDGRGLLERLRSDERFAGTPVVVMTAEAGPLPPGAAGVLRKPVRLEMLLEATRRHCPVAGGVVKTPA
ncbi:response regulator [Myxococcus sp. SDU36]|uniref:response regulator n=1 Tax=Myxococcus sp. SDU36 TaxID=2831967 RepID=UPI002542ACFE|nr:response regulator [Myxococcus sp. SDU36]WIG93679.1 response regulator [Myxococcus sp. SDU36]